MLVKIFKKKLNHKFEVSDDNFAHILQILGSVSALVQKYTLVYHLKTGHPNSGFQMVDLCGVVNWSGIQMEV